MNYLDVIIIIPLIWGAFNGFRKGLVIEVASLLALLLGIYGAIRFSSVTAKWLHQHLDWSEQAIYLLSFALTFMGIVLLIHLLARLIQKMVKLAALGAINRILGSLFGTIKYLIIVSSIFFLANKIDSKYPFIDANEKESSLLYMPIVNVIPSIYPRIKEQMDDKNHSMMAAIPGKVLPSRYSIKAPPPVDT